MPRDSTPSILLVVGVATVGSGIGLFLPGRAVGVESGVRWLFALTFTTVGCGFLGMAGISLRRGEPALLSRTQIPAVVLFGVGALWILGSVPVFQPHRYDGLAGGLRLLLTSGLVVAGSVALLLGIRWYRRRQPRYPLAVSTGVLGLGFLYVAHQELGLNLPFPFLTVLTVLAIALPVVVTLRLFEPTAFRESTR